MNIYHITWFETIDDFRSKGENFNGDHPADAIAEWGLKYPNTIFLSCVSMEVLNRRGISQG